MPLTILFELLVPVGRNELGHAHKMTFWYFLGVFPNFQTSSPSYFRDVPSLLGYRVGKFLYIPLKRGEMGAGEDVMGMSE